MLGNDWERGEHCVLRNGRRRNRDARGGNALEGRAGSERREG